MRRLAAQLLGSRERLRRVECAPPRLLEPLRRHGPRRAELLRIQRNPQLLDEPAVLDDGRWPWPTLGPLRAPPLERRSRRADLRRDHGVVALRTLLPTRTGRAHVTR